MTDAATFDSAFGSGTASKDGKIKLKLENDVTTNTGGGWIVTPSNSKVYINLNGYTLTVNEKLCTSNVGNSTSASLTVVDKTVDGEGRETGKLGTGKIVTSEANTQSNIFEAGYKGSSLTLDHVSVESAKQVIDASGADGTTGNVVLSNCTLKGTGAASVGNGGAVYAKNKNVKITNTSISNYQVTGNGGAVYLDSSNLAIGDDANDTTDISGNHADNQGGAVFTTGGSESNKYTISLNGGKIENNNAEDSGGGFYAGGLYDFNLTAGTISGNHAKNTIGNHVSGGGGGIRLSGGGANTSSTFVMTGGTITGNWSDKFTNADGSSVGAGGGGIKANHYDPETGKIKVEIRNGTFYGNHSHGEGGAISLGAHVNGTIGPRNDNDKDFVKIENNAVDPDTSDWGGGGVFVADGGTLLIQKALVYDNTAEGFGGGVAGCSTGRIVINSNGQIGTAIYGNTANGDLEGGLSGGSSAKHDDHVIAKGNTEFLNDGYQDYFCALNSTVNEEMLGGGSENWSGSYDSKPIHADDDHTEYSASSIMGLTSNPSQKGMEAADAAKRVYIYNNHSGTHGGGILCNGIMVMGAVENNIFNDRLIVSGLKGLSDGTTNLVTYSGENRAFDFELVQQVDGKENTYENVATKNTYAYDNPHNVNGENDAVISKGDKGIINITIPYVVAKNDTLANDGDQVNNKQMVFYLREKDNGLDYKTNQTVYQIKVDGNQRLEHDRIGAEENLMAVNINQITKAQVTKGTIENAKYDDKDQLVSGKFKAADQNIDYAVKLDTGVQHAKYLWLGITGDELVNGQPDTTKRNLDEYTANNQNRTDHTVTDQKNNVIGDGTTDFAGGLDSNWGVRDIDDGNSYSDAEQKQWSVHLQDAFTNEKVKSYSVEKEWVDADNADGLRLTDPVPVQVQLYTVNKTDGSRVDRVGDPVPLQADKNGKLTYTWENLPYGNDYVAFELDKNGNPVEDKGTVSNGYTAGYTPVKNIEVSAYNHPADGVTYKLTVNGAPAKDVFGNDVPEINLNDGNWTGTFRNLNPGTEYEVEVSQNGAGPDYLYNEYSVFTYDGRYIKNTHQQKLTEVGVTKVWKTSDPSTITSVTLDLYADGKKSETISPIVLDGAPDDNGEDTPWHAQWNNLPANRYDAEQKKSVPIKYTVVEENVPARYKEIYRLKDTTVDGSTADGGEIWNIHQTDITVTKKWEDNNDSYGKRPGEIKVRLRRDSKHTVGETVKLNAGKQWTYTWSALPEYDNNGNKITYEVEEISKPEHYKLTSSESSGNQIVLTNTYIQNDAKVTVHKTFKGDQISDKDQKNLKFRITGVGKKIDENGNAVDVKVDQTVGYASFKNGSYTFSHLYPGEYTVTETNSGIKGYKSEVKYVVDGKSSQKVNAAESGEEYKIEITDTYHKEGEAPDTSDHNNVPWNAGIAGIALLIGMTAALFRKRYN